MQEWSWDFISSIAKSRNGSNVAETLELVLNGLGKYGIIAACVVRTVYEFAFEIGRIECVGLQYQPNCQPAQGANSPAYVQLTSLGLKDGS